MKYGGALLGVFVAGACRAQPGISLGVGDGDGSLQMLRASVLVGGPWTFGPASDWPGRASVEAGISVWRADSGRMRNRSLNEVGLTPLCRFQRAGCAPVRPYVELGLGLHAISDETIENRDLGSRFHFGTVAGAGAVFGEAGSLDIGVRWHHLSNAGIEPPNDGATFVVVRLTWWYPGRTAWREN
jgi:lipid A 3-O-deacylase